MSQADLDIKAFIDAMFGENAYVLSTPGSDNQRIGWLIDPGLADQAERILAYLQARNIQLERMLLTHGHGDHIAGVDTVARRHPAAKLMIAAADEPMLTDATLNLSDPFGIHLQIQTPAAEHLEPDMDLTLGTLRWTVLDTSGHSPGGRSLHCRDAGVVFTGDALFAGSIGRTDFPGSEHARLISNIHRHLLTLPPATRVYSGHGPVTTIEREVKFNPFLSD
ncbi:MAG TPA: MBL fold metallo-hydrolase [Phycisphaerae bacterium]|nr:MBL fold metallo-hydrolase [Phycisphaerae bacterium]HRY67285.1 MBL fold metallo-hydrolase [Phycisphaerae bacterium]HSA26345.1 MBL fold metallo-hydrolase [Phycisphaerae bacterium]